MSQSSKQKLTVFVMVTEARVNYGMLHLLLIKSNYSNATDESRRTYFQVWTRFIYGSGAAERNAELAEGLLENTIFAVPVTVVAITNAVYDALKSMTKEDLIAFSQFMALATISSEYRQALETMILNTISALPIYIAIKFFHCGI